MVIDQKSDDNYGNLPGSNTMQTYLIEMNLDLGSMKMPKNG